MSEIFMYSALIASACMIGTYIVSFSAEPKIRKNKLHIHKNDVMIEKVSYDKALRGKITDELSRQKLVFSKEEGAWVKRRQIN